MLGRIFGKPKEEPTMRDSLDKLAETREMLEKKEKVLQKKIAAELEKARDFTKQKNKRAALQCLKKKKLYESQIEALSNYQFRLQDQEVMLEGANATIGVVSAMKHSAQVLKNVQKQMNIDDVDKTMDEINEQTENMKMIQDALSQPVAAAEFDEDELMMELEELEGLELDEQLLQPTTAQPAAATAQQLPSVPTRVPVAQKAKTPVMSEEEEELEKLKAEMAL
eukprot:TRINITY_DN1275_c0_g1_i1.p1 TRINITY_DN1275_c0_g1~~TRINITY_DN1275_c0_g1_i1.p1  ORF type:complete len:224 (+),score=85.46 TRINITY_DN1275_c0_g1_i1:199-870(+)